uniref:Importin-9-like n=1 Tax=Dermatophagoides pteronyssinus TaxID=6956 RepID=A0A6P6YFC6_DERPT|nr:importin-9-like [Dermatophagoides pteronyssinus]
MANNNNLKEIICHNLNQALSMDKNLRENAEQQLNMLETNEDYGLHLMEITLSENLDFSIRHLASIILNRYITKHWCNQTEKFEPPEISEQVKQLIRDYLLKSLVITSGGGGGSGGNNDENIHKLLSSFAHSISNIAQYDWPQQWPQLFPTLNQYLSYGQQPNAIYSSLKVFQELAHEITDTQIPDIAPILLPQLLNIFISKKFPIHTSTKAVKIFGIISETIMAMNDLDKNAIKQYLADYIPRFTEYAIEVLMTSDTNDTVDIGMKKEIISILTQLLRYCRKYMKVYLPKILGLIWQHLTTSAQIYVKFKVNSSMENNDDFNDTFSETIIDSDGETISFESLIYSIIDFVNSTFEFAKYRLLIKPVLSDLLYYLLCFVQMTDEQMEKWQSNLDQLIEEDDIDTAAFSIRIAAQDLIMNLARDMTTLDDKHTRKDDELFKIAFLQAVQRHFSEASELEKTQKSRQTWKIIESCLYVMGILSPTIIYTIKSGKNTANEYRSILDNVLLNLNMTESFMAGRSLWTASRFSEIMNDQSLDNFLRITSTLLNNIVDAPILSVYALRATYYFFENVQINQRVQVIRPHLQQFLQGLITIGMNCNSDTLYLVLQIIDLLSELDKEFTCSASSSICSISLSSFLRFPDDTIIFDVVLSIFDHLFSIEQCFPEIQKRLLPIIVAILNSNPNDSNILELLSSSSNKISAQNMSILQPQILDMLTKILNHSNGLNDFMIEKVYPSMIDCLNKAYKDSSAIFQNGTECLSAFLRKGSDFLVRYIDPTTNQNGIILALNICINLLNPHTSDSSAAFVGRLIVILIMQSNQIIGHENIQHLLRSTLVRLNTSKELPIMQSLILVFAHLLYMDLSTILVFLNTLPAPDGTKSALEFVMDKWLGIQRYFHGYENKASTVALCRLFQHALQQQQQQQANTANNQDNSNSNDLNFINLNQIQVSCDDEFDCMDSLEHTSARTRSQMNQLGKNLKQKKRFVPCTLKILKLLINEMIHIQEYKTEHNDDDDDVEDFDDDDDDFDSDEDDDDDDNQLGQHLDSSMKSSNKQQMIDLTDLLAMENDQDDDDDDDNEILSEEIGELDLENVLRNFLCEFRQLPMARDFIVHLTSTESNLLERL